MGSENETPAVGAVRGSESYSIASAIDGSDNKRSASDNQSTFNRVSVSALDLRYPSARRGRP